MFPSVVWVARYCVCGRFRDQPSSITHPVVHEGMPLSALNDELRVWLATEQIRQYFMNETFYAADMTARGFCEDWFGCETFSPSAATIKVWFTGIICIVVNYFHALY